MQFYIFKLDEQSKELCTIVTQMEKYQYDWLSMGMKCSPDIAQETMEEVLCGLGSEVYIDDIAIFSTSWYLGDDKKTPSDLNCTPPKVSR